MTTPGQSQSFHIIGDDGRPIKADEIIVSKCPLCKRGVIHGFGQNLELVRLQAEPGPGGQVAVCAKVHCAGCKHDWELPLMLAPVPPQNGSLP